MKTGNGEKGSPSKLFRPIAALSFLAMFLFSAFCPARAAENDAWVEYRNVAIGEDGSFSAKVPAEARLVKADTGLRAELIEGSLRGTVEDSGTKEIEIEVANGAGLIILRLIRPGHSEESGRKRRREETAASERRPRKGTQPAREETPSSTTPPIPPAPEPLVLRGWGSSFSKQPRSASRPGGETAPRVTRLLPEKEEGGAGERGESGESEEPAALPSAPQVVLKPVPRGEDKVEDTGVKIDVTAKQGEKALFVLGVDLAARGLYTDAIRQFKRLLKEFPKTRLRSEVELRIGEAYEAQGKKFEEEALRQKDLRRSGAAAEALDEAISNYTSAVESYRSVIEKTRDLDQADETQLRLARALHGVVRTRFEKTNTPEDSPTVVVEYLKSFVGKSDTHLASQARMGIADYYRDLGDARLLVKMESKIVKRAYERAIEEYDGVAKEYPGSPEAERALFEIARLYDRNLEMRQFDAAVKYYELLLKRFPGSRFAAEARQRRDWIRKNYL